jgi:predicted  nucleic acid-binding Zn-ribbon protein
MDIAKALDELSKLEQEKAKMEERVRQLEESKDGLAKKMAELNVHPETLDDEIKAVEARVQDAFKKARDPNFKAEPVPPAKAPEMKAREPMEEVLSMEGFDA